MYFWQKFGESSKIWLEHTWIFEGWHIIFQFTKGDFSRKFGESFDKAWRKAAFSWSSSSPSSTMTVICGDTAPPVRLAGSQCLNVLRVLLQHGVAIHMGLVFGEQANFIGNQMRRTPHSFCRRSSELMPGQGFVLCPGYGITWVMQCMLAHGLIWFSFSTL